MKRRPFIEAKEEQPQEEIPDQAGVKAMEDFLSISRKVNKQGELKIVKENTKAQTMVSVTTATRKDIMLGNVDPKKEVNRREY